MQVYEDVLMYVRALQPTLPIVVLTLCPDFRYPSKHMKYNYSGEIWSDKSHPIWEVQANAGCLAAIGAVHTLQGSSDR